MVRQIMHQPTKLGILTLQRQDVFLAARVDMLADQPTNTGMVWGMHEAK